MSILENKSVWQRTKNNFDFAVSKIKWDVKNLIERSGFHSLSEFQSKQKLNLVIIYNAHVREYLPFLPSRPATSSAESEGWREGDKMTFSFFWVIDPYIYDVPI